MLSLVLHLIGDHDVAFERVVVERAVGLHEFVKFRRDVDRALFSTRNFVKEFAFLEVIDLLLRTYLHDR